MDLQLIKQLDEQNVNTSQLLNVNAFNRCKLMFWFIGTDWIQLLPDDTTMAYCQLCDINLEAEFQCLESHSNTHQHQQLRRRRTEETSSSSGKYCSYLFPI